MKKLILIGLVAISIISCKKNNDTSGSTNSLLPTKINIDMPSALSAQPSSNKSATTDTIKGNDLYNQLRAFIWIGDQSARVVQEIINAISKYNINKAMSIDFTSNDDGHKKHLEVTEKATFNNKIYQYKMVISDSIHPGLQMFWNTQPVEGVAIMSPEWMNRNTLNTGAMYMIEYGQGTSTKYDKQMTVSISGLPVIGVWGLDNLKMFVGKKGNLLEVYGNSDHPKAIILNTKNTDGFSYSFTARVDTASNIAVVNLGLPGTSLAKTDSIFTTYSITNVFSGELHWVFDPLLTGKPQIVKDYYNAKITSWLQNAQIPAYFKNKGFVSCGTVIPSGFYAGFSNLSTLLPYAPVDVKNLKVQFAQ
jgi:hypothetical protein